MKLSFEKIVAIILIAIFLIWGLMRISGDSGNIDNNLPRVNGLNGVRVF